MHLDAALAEQRARAPPRPPRPRSAGCAAASRPASPREPNERKIEANSVPTAPAPSTTIDLRHPLQLEHVVGVDDRLAVGRRDRDLARHRAGGDHARSGSMSVALLAVGAGDLDRVRAGEPAVAAGCRSTLFFLNRPSIALGVLVDHARACRRAPWRCRASARRRRCRSSSAWRIWSSTSAVCSSALVGMQPRCRQVPPSFGSFSTTADLQPELAGADRRRRSRPGRCR